MLSVMIMILLSITVGVAWKHWELLNTIRGEKVKADEIYDVNIETNNSKTMENNV